MKKRESNKFSNSKRVFFVISLFLINISCNNNHKINGNIDSKIRNPIIVLNLPPSENNPRNSEGDFITLKDGKLLYVYTHYYNGNGLDHDPAFLASRYSLDDGITWTSEDNVVVANDGFQNIMSVSLLRLMNGDIALFYAKKNSLQDCVPMMRISKDEGENWEEPIKCIDKKGYYVLNNDRVIQLKDGRLMFAVAEHKSTDEVFNPQGDLYCYYSDDSGRTWHTSQKVPNNTSIITQEPGLIELSDGGIMMYIRASGGKQQISYSDDKGESWSHIESSNISSPLSPASIEKIPKTKDWIMVWNNNDGSTAGIKGRRNPLTVAISKNEGKSWKMVKDIETQKDGWYCYTAIHFINENDVILSYCAGKMSNKSNWLSHTRIKMLDKTWLYKD